MKFKDDYVLTQALRKGEEKAYMFLLEKYHRRLHAYALSLANNHVLAQDIVQNVFLKTWRFREKLNSDYSIKSFLFKSVYNEFINTYQKNKSTMLLQYKYIESLYEVAEGSDESVLEIMIEIVNKEIQSLPPKCRQVFELSKKEGLTNAEIAEYLNVSIKTVEAQITKSFSLLREKLGDKYEAILFFVFINK
ncbi:RNA polymerase sigma factor [Aquimarina macrocephali]|uniref:RNA polymerase sigma factor n=1 Tax=Aquimarina macrocephali TaxID=666563 RepID=UPI0004630F4D|nr:sigma-70 family RNA polymerase sigma factor [Aquimarina macrocephali]